MKIRNGFVSNSSSSSFLIYGTYVKPKDILETKIQELYEKNKDQDWCESVDDMREALLDDLSDFDDLFHSGSDPRYSGYAAGHCPSECPNDMTMGEWKANVKKELAEWVGEEKANKSSWHEEAWSDR